MKNPYKINRPSLLCNLSKVFVDENENVMILNVLEDRKTSYKIFREGVFIRKEKKMSDKTIKIYGPNFVMSPNRSIRDHYYCFPKAALHRIQKHWHRNWESWVYKIYYATIGYLLVHFFKVLHQLKQRNMVWYNIRKSKEMQMLNFMKHFHRSQSPLCS